MTKYECDFSDISDGEIVTATQLLELEVCFKPDALDQYEGLPLFSDNISDDKLLICLTIVGHYSILYTNAESDIQRTFRWALQLQNNVTAQTDLSTVLSRIFHPERQQMYSKTQGFTGVR